MRRNTSYLVICLAVLVSSLPGIAYAAAEQRTALVIGNGAYTSGPLKNPVNDAADMAAALKRSGFTVALKTNARLQEMEEAVENFGNILKRGGVGLFYFAGHGVQVNGGNYLLPIGAKINKESDVKYQAVDANKILDEMANANNGLNIVMLDACRDNPFAKSFRSASRGLAIVSSAPTGTFISYSTGPGRVARDGEGRNSPYTGALLQYMKEPGLTIEDVFKGVRQKLQKETGQVPWELSSLVGMFSFLPGKGGPATVPVGRASVDDELRAEREKLEAERAQLHKEKELLEQRRALDEERRKLEEEKKQLAVITPAAPAGPKEIKTVDRFIAYDNGTVLDTKTNLMWAAKDNGNDINWAHAESYCKSYRGGGYSDWRMPTLDELAGLYDGNKGYRTTRRGYDVHLTELIQLSSSSLWASTPRKFEEVPAFGFNGQGIRFWSTLPSESEYRTLPVRSVKPASSVKETGRDSRFIAYDNGTVLDTRTNLMWSAKDNGSRINWEDAKRYCEKYRGGGYIDWRMPTQAELAGLYDSSLKGYPQDCGSQYGAVRLTNLIHVTCFAPWASDRKGAEGGFVYMTDGVWSFVPTSGMDVSRILPVRSVKKDSAVKEIGRDGRFIAYDNGTVLDTKTKLLWAAEDKYGINWQEARGYCETYRGGGYTDWRMPTKNELAELYDKTKLSRTAGGRDAYLTELIHLTRSTWIWASETRGSDAAYLSFGALGTPEWDPQNDSSLSALPVRSAK